METSTGLKEQFLIDPDITFLNFGSFGACPRPVFADYQRWQLLLEREPVQFIAVNGPANLATARKHLGIYAGCQANDLVFVPNPSYAVNIIARSFPLKEGDEVLTTALEYGACDKTWSYYCGKKGARLVRRQVTLPLVSTGKFIEEFFSGVNKHTKLIYLSHITSTTALILPVKEIINIARSKGILTFIDGAHVPGHLPLDLTALGADIYTGACHKWMLAPKGCSFLYVKEELQHLFDPLVISWGYDSPLTSGSKFIDYHQGQGTRDFSAFLSVSSAIKFMNDHHWPQIASTCRQLVIRNAGRFCELLGTKPLCPVNEEFVGQMLSLPVVTTEPEQLQKLLFGKYHIEIPVMRHGDMVYIRYSINAFNTQHDLDKLHEALGKIRQETKLLG